MASRRPNYEDVTVPAAFAGSAAFTIPEHATDVTLSAPAGSSSAEIGIRPLTIDGESTGITASEAGTGIWQMRQGMEPTSAPIGFDAQIAGGPLVCLLTYWT